VIAAQEFIAMSPLISGLASVASLIFNATSGGSGRQAASRRGDADSQAQPSAVLSLSPQAEALAGFAGKGILVSQGQLDKTVGAAVQTARTSVAQPAVQPVVTTEEFKEMLTRFGADDAQKAQLTAGFDANQDGAITQQEFLQGLAKTRGTEAGSGFSQTVMELMDRSGVADGKVADREFAAFSSAFALAGARRSGVA
jgi:hypothetical protein